MLQMIVTVVAALFIYFVSSSSSKPNVIFILLDDLGFSDVGWNALHGLTNDNTFNDNFSFSTPTLDSLAQNSIRLNYHYSEPLCSPTRSSLLTGNYAYKTNVGSVIQPNTNVHTSLSLKLIPEILKDNQYKTLMTGKYHIGYQHIDQLPFNRGFDKCIWYMFSIDFYTKQRCIRWSYYDDPNINILDENIINERNNLYGDQGLCGYDLFDENYNFIFDQSTYLERIFVDEIIDFIDTNQYNDEPYFIYYASHTPHDPYQLPPNNYNQQCQHITDTDRNILCQMMLYVDELINEILQHIDDNTIIIFAGDNGATLSGQNLPLRGLKQSVFEGGIRSPSFIYAPFIINGCDYNKLAFIGDWFPTILDMIGIDIDNNINYKIDGINLLPDIIKQCPYSFSHHFKKKLHRNRNRKYTKCNNKVRDKIFRLGLCNNNGEKGDIDINNSFFYSSYIRWNEWKLVVNASITRCPSNPSDASLFDDKIFTSYKNIFDNGFDENVNIKPNQQIYEQFMSSDKDFLYRSVTYDTLSDSEKNDKNNFLYEEIMLFNIDNDPIESINLSLQFPEMVDSLLSTLQEEKQHFNARNRQNPLAIGVLRQVETYDCNLNTNFQKSWMDDPRYTDEDFNDWNYVWNASINQINACSP